MKAVWNVEGARLVARTEGGREVAGWEVGEGIEAPLLAAMFNQAPAVSRLVLSPWISDNEAPAEVAAGRSSGI